MVKIAVPSNSSAGPARASTTAPAAPGATRLSTPDGSQFSVAEVSQDILIPPFTIIYDQQEGAPYRFSGIRADADKNYRPLVIRTVKRHLATGDYTIEGMEDRLTVERKSLSDLYNTLGQGRERFEREHQRMAAMVQAGGFACVLVESSLEEALLRPPLESGLLPKTVDRTRISWAMKYGVPWFFEESRRRAEVTCYRILEKAWEREQERLKAEQQEQASGRLF